MAWFQQVLSTLKCHGRGQAFRDFLNVGGRMKKVFSLDCQTCCFSLESDGVTTVIDALFSIFPVLRHYLRANRQERKEATLGSPDNSGLSAPEIFPPAPVPGP